MTYEGNRAVVRGVASAASSSRSDCMIPEAGAARFADVFAHRDWILSTIAMTDAQLAGNTRVRWSGRAARGVIGLGCTNPAGTLWGPLNVAGVEEGANCPAGETQSIVCSLQGAQPQLITAFTMKTTYANGTTTTTSLPFSGSWASYYGLNPEGVTREFTCAVGPPSSPSGERRPFCVEGRGRGRDALLHAAVAAGGGLTT